MGFVYSPHTLFAFSRKDRGDVGIPHDANFSIDTMALYEMGGNIGNCPAAKNVENK